MSKKQRRVEGFNYPAALIEKVAKNVLILGYIKNSDFVLRPGKNQDTDMPGLPTQPRLPILDVAGSC